MAHYGYFVFISFRQSKTIVSHFIIIHHHFITHSTKSATEWIFDWYSIWRRELYMCIFATINPKYKSCSGSYLAQGVTTLQYSHKKLRIRQYEVVATKVNKVRMIRTVAELAVYSTAYAWYMIALFVPIFLSRVLQFTVNDNVVHSTGTGYIQCIILSVAEGVELGLWHSHYTHVVIVVQLLIITRKKNEKWTIKCLLCSRQEKNPREVENQILLLVI
jgi:hypothetical protein